MKKQFTLKSAALAFLATFFYAATSFGQTTITTGVLNPTTVCVGGEVSVPFATTGTAAPLTSYVAQLSDETGAFGSPENIGSSTTSPITATIKPVTKPGAAYKIRVVSFLALVQVTEGTESAALKINAIPAAPTVTSPVIVEQGKTATLTASGTGLKWYAAATGGQELASKPIPDTNKPGSTSYFVSQTSGGCESERAEIVVTVEACTPPAKPVVTTPVSYVKGKTADPLQATALTKAKLNWYGTNATGGTAVATAPTPSTDVIGTTTYYVSQTLDECESARAEIVVNVTACTPPAKPVVTTPVSYVKGKDADPLQATALTKAKLNWYGTNATGGTAVATAPTPTTEVIGTTTYYVSQTLDECESARAEIVVNVTACTPPAKPVVTTPVSYVKGKNADPLQATALSNAKLNWYGTNATGGTAVATAPTPSTDVIGTTTYYVSQTLDECESARAAIVVNVTACTLSAEPTVTSALNYCAGNGLAAALTATGTSIKWYNSEGVALSTAPRPDLNVSSTKEYKYYVTQTESGKCESTKKEVTITVYKITPPVVKADVVEYCMGVAATALQATGTELKWYNSSTGNVEVSPIPDTKEAKNLIYYVSQTSNGCVSERSRIDVKIKPKPTKPVAAVIPAVCVGTNVAAAVLLNAVTPKTNLSWYETATSTTSSETPSNPDTKTSGVKNFYVSQTSNGCESERAVVSIEVKALPAVPKVTSLVEYCKDDKNAVALSAEGTALTWYNQAGTKLTAAPKPPTTVVEDITYSVTQTIDQCESKPAEVKVRINALPSNLVSISDSLCQERTPKLYTFKIEASAGNKLIWYNAETTGDPLSAAPTIDLSVAGTKINYATQENSKGCESPKRVAQKIRVKPLPALPAIANPTIEYCQFIKADPLTATPMANATLNWFGTDATGGTSSNTAPVPSTAEGGTTSYYVGQTLEGCLGDRAKIDVKVNTTPKPTTDTYLEFCQGENAPILDATGTVLKWYRTVDGEWQGFPFTPFTDKVQDYSFYVTQTGLENKCESPKEEIKIHIKSKPSATISGNSTIDLGETANVNIKFTGDGPWIYILSDGTTDTTDQANHQVPVKPSTTTSYLVTEVSNACGKGIPIGNAMVTVKIPTISSGNPSVSEACAGKTFTVPFQQSGDFPAENTFKVQIATENEDSKFYTIPSVATSNSITATFPDTTKGGNYYLRVVSSGTNPAFLVKGSVSSITIAASPLPVATLSGAQTILVGESATLKVEVTGKAPWTFTLSNGTKDTLITANATPYTFKIAPPATVTYNITKVTNSCGTGTGAGAARVQVDPILGVEPQQPTDWVKVYPTLIESAVTVEVSGSIKPKQARIEVIDLNGKSRSVQAIEHKTTEVNFSNYPSGLYLLRIQNGNLSTVQRVMKP
jgi:hypothetical protein